MNFWFSVIRNYVVDRVSVYTSAVFLRYKHEVAHMLNPFVVHNTQMLNPFIPTQKLSLAWTLKALD